MCVCVCVCEREREREAKHLETKKVKEQEFVSPQSILGRNR